MQIKQMYANSQMLFPGGRTAEKCVHARRQTQTDTRMPSLANIKKQHAAISKKKKKDISVQGSLFTTSRAYS